ncbi:MAG: TonB-dependent receptor [bacterium]|nr:TonB-dependent receptor [bacterium]
MNQNLDQLLNYAKSLVIGQTEDLTSFQGVEEDNIAAYAMARFETEGIRGNFGVRYVQTDAASNYYIRDEVTDELLSKKAEANYSEFLPSVNLVFNLSDRVLLRTSLARVISRPQYVDMYMTPDRSGVDPNIDTNPFLITGNVALKPFLAYQADISAEWYYSPGSFVSVGLFRKDIESFIKFETEYDVYIDDPVDPGLWNVQQKTNGEGGTIEGIELQWTHDFNNGFGMILNATKTNTEVAVDTFDDRNPELTDSSALSYNLIAYYENARVRARLAYNWRDDNLMREPGAYGNRRHEAFGTLDGSFTVHLSKHFDVYVEASNILEEMSGQFGANNIAAGAAAGSGFSAGFPLYEYQMGRRLFVGTSFNF